MNKVQLANPYNPAKNYRVAHWFATPKFDGVRAVFIPDRGFFTRNDKPISGLDHMAGILQEFCFTRGLSFIDGELVLAGGSFQASQSAILSVQHDAKSNIDFHVFAVGGNFKDTQEMLRELPDFPDARIFRVQSTVINNTQEAVDEACRKFTQQGYEGVVLRHPYVPYYEGRSNHLLKHKFFKEADLRIIGAVDGEGRLAGTLGSLIVEGTIGGLLVKSCVGTGLTDEDRKILSKDAHIIGKVLTVKYQSITDKPDKDGFYSLRFPSVIGVKEDRDFEPEQANIRQSKTYFPEPSGVAYKSNGLVEAGFQVVFTDKPLGKLSYIPDKATLAGWKSRLYQCRSIQEGTKLIADLKLTIAKIRVFARYVGVRLRGCKFLKAEIVRWVINASLGAKLRAEAILREVQCERLLRVAGSKSSEINSGDQQTAFRVLGVVRDIYVSGRAGVRVGQRVRLRGARVMTKAELLSRIRSLQRELDGLVDAVITMEDPMPKPQTVVQEPHDGWLTVAQVCEELHISSTTFYQWLNEGLLPPGLEFGPRSKRWKMSDIRAWQEKQRPCEVQRKRGRRSRVVKVRTFLNA